MIFSSVNVIESWRWPWLRFLIYSCACFHAIVKWFRVDVFLAKSHNIYECLYGTNRNDTVLHTIGSLAINSSAQIYQMSFAFSKYCVIHCNKSNIFMRDAILWILTKAKWAFRSEVELLSFKMKKNEWITQKCNIKKWPHTVKPIT